MTWHLQPHSKPFGKHELETLGANKIYGLNILLLLITLFAETQELEI
jgi:hypothetical protein